MADQTSPSDVESRLADAEHAIGSVIRYAESLKMRVYRQLDAGELADVLLTICAQWTGGLTEPADDPTPPHIDTLGGKNVRVTSPTGHVWEGQLLAYLPDPSVLVLTADGRALLPADFHIAEAPGPPPHTGPIDMHHLELPAHPEEKR